jgi:membrane fusion protein, heavy metal efflux system
MRRRIFQLPFNKRLALLSASAAAAATVMAAGAYLVLHGRAADAAEATAAAAGAAAPKSDGARSSSSDSGSVQLTDSQLGAIKIAAVGEHDFVLQKDAVGIIDFNQDMNVQVFTPYQGRIIQTFADLGDMVKKDQILFTIESPDFIAAESNLIGAAATLDQTASALERAKRLYAAHGIDQNDYETAVANQQTAEGALKAARDAVAIFGRTQEQIDHVVAARQVEPALIVKSPISGRVTARSAAPGLLEQPGNAPAPYSVADLSTKWMVANVIETDSPLFREGQPIRASVLAYPGRIFTGKVSRLGRSLDPNTHRVVVRCDIADFKDELIPGMLASFAIQVREPVKSLAIPVNGVVRNTDGTYAAWTTIDRRRFTQRIVKLGEPQDGEYPVLAGLERGEMAVTDGAVFLSNILYAPPTD